MNPFLHVIPEKKIIVCRWQELYSLAENSERFNVNWIFCTIRGREVCVGGGERGGCGVGGWGGERD